MKKYNNITSCLYLLLLFSVNVFAQSINVVDNSGTVGSTVTVDVQYLADGNDEQFQYTVNFDTSILSFVSCTPQPITLTGQAFPTGGACNNPAIAPSEVRFVLSNSTGNPVTAGTVLTAQIVFNIDAVPGGGTTNLTLSSVGFTPSGTNGAGVNSDGVLTISAAPTPAYTSNPATGSTLTFATVLEGGTADTQTVDITNTGDSGTTLSGSCAVTGADLAAYTINSGGSYSVAQGAAANRVEVQCNTTTAGTYNSASLDCTSTAGGNGSYPLNCTVASPAPTYSSTPAAGSTIDVGTAFSGSGNLTTSLEISNTGDAGSTLNSGNCALSGTNMGSFSIGANLSNAAAISVGTPVSANITCNDPGIGNGNGTTLTATLSCDNDDGGTNPQTYSLQCTYNEPGQAQYDSTPADGATIEMTTGTGILVGSASPTTSIDISNPAPNASDNDLGLEACTYTGDAAISVTSTDPLTTSLAPQSADTATVAFSCDTAAVGNYTGTYDCPYSTDGAAGAEGTASYTVNCDVRAAASAGSPVDGTMSSLNIVAPPGGSQTGSFTFSETNNEGADVTNLSCAIDGGTSADFSITTAPTATVASGTSSDLVVTLTDGGNTPLTGSVTCTYDDSVMAGNTVTINLSGSIRAIVVPTLSYIGYVAMILGLLFVGFVGFRRRA